jgi:hypothetical protein
MSDQFILCTIVIISMAGLLTEDPLKRFRIFELRPHPAFPLKDVVLASGDSEPVSIFNANIDRRDFAGLVDFIFADWNGEFSRVFAAREGQEDQDPRISFLDEWRQQQRLL